jgi:hypothetical protein
MSHRYGLRKKATSSAIATDLPDNPNDSELELASDEEDNDALVIYGDSSDDEEDE